MGHRSCAHSIFGAWVGGTIRASYKSNGGIETLEASEAVPKSLLTLWHWLAVVRSLEARGSNLRGEWKWRPWVADESATRNLPHAIEPCMDKYPRKS